MDTKIDNLEKISEISKESKCSELYEDAVDRRSSTRDANSGAIDTQNLLLPDLESSFRSGKVQNCEAPNRLPEIEFWPLDPTENYKIYNFKSGNANIKFSCPIKNGQPFGFGYFHVNKQKSDYGLWRGRNLLYLDHHLSHSSKLYEIVNFISEKYLSAPHYPVLEQVRLADSPEAWEISAILSEQGQPSPRKKENLEGHDPNDLYCQNSERQSKSSSRNSQKSPLPDLQVKILETEAGLEPTDEIGQGDETAEEHDQSQSSQKRSEIDRSNKSFSKKSETFEDDNEKPSSSQSRRQSQNDRKDQDDNESENEIDNDIPITTASLQESEVHKLPKISIQGNFTKKSLLFLKSIEENNFEATMQILQTKQVDVNVADKDGITGLILAATTTFNPKMVNFLINHGANVKQTIKTPFGFSPLRVCLSMLYCKVDFSVILERVIDVGQQVLPPIISKNAVSKRRVASNRNLLAAGGPMQNSSHNLLTGKFHSGKNKTAVGAIGYFNKLGQGKHPEPPTREPTIYPEYILLVKQDQKKRMKLVEIIKILIRRGAVISKYILALVILANDSKLLEIVEEFGCWEDDQVYSNYIIGDYKFNIFHIAALAKFDSQKMMKVLLRKLKKLDINERVLYCPEATSQSADGQTLRTGGQPLTPFDPESRSSVFLDHPDGQTGSTRSGRSSISGSKVGRKSVSSRTKNDLSSRSGFLTNEEEAAPNLKFADCRPIDLAIMKKVSDFELVTLLSQVTDRLNTCPVYRGHTVETRLNFMQLGMAVHGAQLTNCMLNPAVEGPDLDSPSRASIQFKETFDPAVSPRGENSVTNNDILTVFNIIDIQYAPLKYSGDAEKRLALLDSVFAQNPHLSICTGLPDNDYFSSKTVVDFAYYQFNNYTKSKQSIASLEKQERIALFENKVLIRGVCDRFRAAGYRPLNEEELQRKLKEFLAGSASGANLGGDSTILKPVDATELVVVSAAQSTAGAQSAQYTVHRTVSRQRSAHAKQTVYETLPESVAIGQLSKKDQPIEPRFLFNFCYECCRSILKNSAGRVENLKKLSKLISLDRDVYFCSSYCKNKVSERLKAENYLVVIQKKNKHIQRMNKIADEITALHVTYNTSDMTVGNGPVNTSSHGRASYYSRPSAAGASGLDSSDRKSLFSNKQKSPRMSVRRTTSPDRLKGLRTDPSLLSLRNHDFSLPTPVNFFENSHLKQMGLVNDLKENYSFN